MKLYDIYELGRKGRATDIVLPPSGRSTEIALCTTTASDPPLRGTGTGWVEITMIEARRLLGWRD